MIRVAWDNRYPVKTLDGGEKGWIRVPLFDTQCFNWIDRRGPSRRNQTGRQC
jgi:hypothetical protein